MQQTHFSRFQCPQNNECCTEFLLFVCQFACICQFQSLPLFPWNDGAAYSAACQFLLSARPDLASCKTGQGLFSSSLGNFCSVVFPYVSSFCIIFSWEMPKGNMERKADKQPPILLQLSDFSCLVICGKAKIDHLAWHNISSCLIHNHKYYHMQQKQDRNQQGGQ